MPSVSIIVDGYHCGNCDVCGETDYACSPYGTYPGLCWPNFVNFNDPVPPGGIITRVTAIVNGEGEPMYGGTLNTTVQINLETIGSGIQEGIAQCNTCYPNIITSPNYPDGLPGYNYGSTNQLYLTVDGVSCVAFVELIFEFVGPTRGIKLF